MARSRLTREEALASIEKYKLDHPGQTHMRKTYAVLGDDTSYSRFVKIKGAVKKLKGYKNRPIPGLGNPAVEAGRSIFYRKGVKQPGEVTNLLVSGHNNIKIGNDVRRGKLFRGYKIFTLALEERATCPRSCHHWYSCYGNNMPYSPRIDHRDPVALMLNLEAEIETRLARRGTVGILIRLHVLGDFFSPEYVNFWGRMLHEHPNLAIFGYTAHAPNKNGNSWEDCGTAILHFKQIYGRRFAIRWSNGKAPGDRALPIVRADARPAGAFICPEQTDRVDGCGKCGLCWNTDKDVAFLEH